MAVGSRIKVTTATTGTGALTLSATGVRDATNGDFLAPAENLAQIGGRNIPYVLLNGAHWAEGEGKLSADGLTLTRDTDERRWNGTTYAAGLLTLTGTTTVILSPTARNFSSSDLGITLAATRNILSL